MKNGSKLNAGRKKSVKRHTPISKSPSPSSGRHVKTTGSSRGNGKKLSPSSKVLGSKSSHSASSTISKKPGKFSFSYLNKTSEIVEKRYNVRRLNPMGIREAYIAIQHEWEVSQIEQWTPQMYHLINLYPVYGMDREDLEQELRLVIMRCLHGYKGGSPASFQTYLYKGMLNKLMTLRTKESRRFQIPDRVMRNGVAISTAYDEVELLSGGRYTPRERSIMKAAMRGMMGKDIREALDLSVKEFNKVRKNIGSKMLTLNPELVTVLEMTRESR
jgi:DNA-directed RNA polymerase specialized sigma24 family protein